MDSDDKPRPKKAAAPRKKTIMAPGSSIERVAQACDRCRAKKVKCDGKSPCSTCANAGLACIVSDKLSRRAFPKGYTETLEERIRQLELENKKLVGLVDLRDEQIELMNGAKSHAPAQSQVTSSNLSKLNHEGEILHEHLHNKGCPCGCSTNPNAVHERPVSIAGSIYDGNVSIAGLVNLSDDDEQSLFSVDEFQNDFEFKRQENPAPGAFAAATAIAQMQKKPKQDLNESNKQQLLTRLVAVSIPRSTEETLFIPTLLAKICQVYGYNSKPAILTANAIALLKENSNESLKDSARSPIPLEFLLKIIMNRNNITKLDELEALYFIQNIKLPTSRIDLDHLITIYFQDWGNAFPILDKISFLKNYVKLIGMLESSEVSHMDESSYELIEKFASIMILVLSLSFLSTKYNQMSSSEFQVSKYVQYLNHYDFLIHEFIKPNCIITKSCSIQSLQILTLALQYCLVIGDITTCYELRGRVITMAQQLRLHRCPAAVLGISGHNGNDVNLQNFMQGERRILFWCIYCLDTYASLNLGVPRLLKDYEIECALPFSGKTDDDDSENENILIINNTRLSIVGKVSRFALSVMLYCKVLGNILDSIFSRYENDAGDQSLEKDRMLDCWRRELPSELKFEIDVNGFSLKESHHSQDSDSFWKTYSRQQLTLIFLYYHAKILIYLPIISKYGNHHNVGLSTKDILAKGQRTVSNMVSSISMIQQSSIQILQVLKVLTKNEALYFLPIPLNIAREQSRFALLVAKGALDYMKGGPLFQNARQLLLDTIGILNAESCRNIPGGLTRNSVKLLEMAILSILGLNINKSVPKRKLQHQPITKTAVVREVPRPNPTEGFDATTDEMFAQAADPVELSSLDKDNNSPDGPDGLESILQFDPFNVDLNRPLLMNEFAADGSLGLVPFLDMANDEEYLWDS